MTGYRHSEQRRFETIESHRLPVVGEDSRYRQRAAFWRALIAYVIVAMLGALVAIAFV